MTEKETLKHFLRAVGGDPDTLPDNLPSTLYDAILTACGGNSEELPAKTPANYLKAIGEICGGSGGGKPVIATFGFQGDFYNFELGMRWDDFIHSEYNTAGFKAVDGFVKTPYDSDVSYDPDSTGKYFVSVHEGHYIYPDGMYV